ncbi:AMP-binding protein [Sphingomonas sp. CGMCC 1.13654]|uniref:AMP-binding protein n=1 Tax=Sphingomonas chungangi TaxID=2683589 RepID=A0A838L6E7_9SPHN|nr:AMP-binding protein [Sphingomonas chungangi]
MTLHEILRFWAKRWPDRLAVRCTGTDISWGELDRLSDRVAAGLAGRDVAKGDRIGILMRNRPEFLYTMLGAMKAGAAVTLLNIRFTPREMLHPIRDAGIRLIVTEPRLAPALSAAVVEVAGLDVISTEPFDDWPTFDVLGDSDAPVPDVAVGADDVALVCYTSGTTGFPKGAMLTHGNLRESGIACAVPSGLTFEDRILVSLPLAYTWGSCQYLREGLAMGATTVVIEPTSDPDRMIDVLERERISVWSAVVVLFEKIAQSPRFRTADFSALREAVTGAASAHLLQTWQSIGVRVTQAYGLTETGGHATLLFQEDAIRKLGSSGRAIMGMELRIADDRGAALPAGEAGEILLRGPGVMKGYINDPAETAKAIQDGWLRTGDTGVVDEEGFLRVVDRTKDMLKSGGLNVYPAELERVLAGVPGLEEFAVIGIGDTRWGEVPMIVAHGARALDLAGLRLRCTEELADYKRPHYVVEHGKPLPRTVSGKILKRDLRAVYAAVPEGAIRLKA